MTIFEILSELSHLHPNLIDVYSDCIWNICLVFSDGTKMSEADFEHLSPTNTLLNELWEKFYGEEDDVALCKMLEETGEDDGDPIPWDSIKWED